MNRTLFVDSRVFGVDDAAWRGRLMEACNDDGFMLRLGEVPAKGRLTSPDLVGIAGLAASVVGVVLGIMSLMRRPRQEQTAAGLRDGINAAFEQHERATRRVVRVDGFENTDSGDLRSGTVLIEENSSEKRIRIVVTKDTIVVSPFDIDSRLY